MAIYLDINATTPCEESVIDKITTAAQYWANPSSGNALGKLAQDVINNSRELIAKMIHGNSRDIIFTSGGTEGNNMVINGILEYYKDWQLHTGMSSSDRPHVITTNVEHDSVILPIRQLEKKKLIDASVIPVSSNGCVNVEELMAQTRPTTCLVTVMMANNETGVIMPIAAIGRCIAEVNEERKSADLVPILFHSDAAQAVGKIPVDVQVLNVNYLTVVGHKAFLRPSDWVSVCPWLRYADTVVPLMYGGGQERGFRPGTENTPMIAGLGEAARLVHLHLCEYSKAMESTRDYLEHKLTAVFGEEGVQFNCSSVSRLPNTSSVSFVGSDLAGHVILSNCQEVMASVGAACHSQKKPSDILIASGVPLNVAKSTVRLSVGRTTTKADVDMVVSALKKVVDQLIARPLGA